MSRRPHHHRTRRPSAPEQPSPISIARTSAAFDGPSAHDTDARTGPRFGTAEHDLDSVLSLMADLDDGTLVLAMPDGSDRAVMSTHAIPTDPRCAGAGLFGLRAPDGAALVGLCFTGHQRLTIPHHAGDGGVDPGRTRVDVVVATGGAVRARIRPADAVGIDRSDATRPLGAVDAPGGIVVDALHRVLARDTPGERPPLTRLVAGLWMAEILDVAAAHAVPTWDAVGAAHDGAAERLRRDGDTSPARIAERMRRLVEEASWEDLHHAAAIGRMTAPELEPHEAGWMDTTMFARWMSDSFPTVEEVTSLLGERGAVDAVDGIEQTLALLGSAPRPLGHAC